MFHPKIPSTGVKDLDDFLDEISGVLTIHLEAGRAAMKGSAAVLQSKAKWENPIVPAVNRRQIVGAFVEMYRPALDELLKIYLGQGPQGLIDHMDYITKGGETPDA